MASVAISASATYSMADIIIVVAALVTAPAFLSILVTCDAESIVQAILGTLCWCQLSAPRPRMQHDAIISPVGVATNVLSERWNWANSEIFINLCFMPIICSLSSIITGFEAPTITVIMDLDEHKFCVVVITSCLAWFCIPPRKRFFLLVCTTASFAYIIVSSQSPSSWNSAWLCFDIINSNDRILSVVF